MQVVKSTLLSINKTSVLKNLMGYPEMDVN